MQLLSPPPDGPKNNGPLLLGILWGEAGFVTLFLIARVWVRAKLPKAFGWDDAWMLLAFILSLTTNAWDTAAIHFGLGQHSGYLPAQNQTIAQFWIWNSFTPSCLWNGAAKATFATTMLRLVIPRWHRWFLYLFIWQLILLEIAQITINYVQCHPVDSLWNVNSDAGSCWDPSTLESFAITKGVYAATVTTIIALFPLTFIGSLKGSRGTKSGLVLSMLLGLIATGCSILQTLSDFNLSSRSDFTWNAQSVVIWSASENFVTMIAATLPVLDPAVVWAKERIAAAMKRSRRPANSVELFSRPTTTMDVYPMVEDTEKPKGLVRGSSRYLPNDNRGDDGLVRPGRRFQPLPLASITPSPLLPLPRFLEQTRRSSQFNTPRTPPPIPKSPFRARISPKIRNMSIGSFLYPATPSPTNSNKASKYPSAGYISKEDQAYLGASAF